MGLGTAAGLGQMIYGNIQKNKLQNQIDANVASRPTYTINPEEKQMLALAESRAGSGMSDAARTAYMNDANAGLSNVTSAILKAGGNPNAIGSAYGSYEKGISKLAMYDDDMRMRNLNNVTNAWARNSANRDKEWQLNKFQPWRDKQTALAWQLQGALNTQNAGFNTFGSGLMGIAGKLAEMNQKPQTFTPTYSPTPQLPNTTSAPSPSPMPYIGLPQPQYGPVAPQAQSQSGDFWWNNGLPQIL